MLSALVLAAVLPLTLPITIDGGDLEQAPAFVQCEEREAARKNEAAACSQAVAEVQESRRLIRNTLVTFGLNTVAHLGLDLGTTEWADNKYACRDAVNAQVCIYETNVLTPTSLGRVAAKVGIVVAVTGLSWFADKSGHTRWAQFIRWLGVAGGVIPAVLNIHRGLTVERAR